MRSPTTVPALFAAFALAACGSSGGEPGAATAANPTPETPESPETDDPMDEAPDPQRAAEERARAAYFTFELTDVETVHGGDWVAFLEHKTAEDQAVAADWHWGPHTPLNQRTPEEARARHALQLEHERVIVPNMLAAQEVAKAVATALLAGDVATVAADCAMYASTPEGVAASEAYLRDQLPQIQRALRAMDPDAEDYAGRVGVEAASPDRGMQAQATVTFGPEAPAPTGDNADDPLYPRAHQMELYWSGPVMPEANGPLNPAPQADVPAEGRWRFSRFVFPYSFRRGALQ